MRLCHSSAQDKPANLRTLCSTIIPSSKLGAGGSSLELHRRARACDWMACIYAPATVFATFKSHLASAWQPCLLHDW